MKQAIILLSLMFSLAACTEKNYYESDPHAMHGNIVGKLLQKSSGAWVIVSQAHPVDSSQIRSSDGSFIIRNLPVGNYDITIKAEDFRILRFSNVMVQGAGNTYIGELDLSTVPDLVSTYYPGDREEIVYNNRYSSLTISITFTQAMDRESVEKAFSTLPATEGIFHWGQYSEAPSSYYYASNNSSGYWGYDKVATITTYSKITGFSYQVARKDCFTDTTYKVSLSTLASDTSGNHLRFPLEFSFSTVQSSSTQNGIETYPEHGNTDVNLISNNGIQIIFPRNMDQGSTESAITVSPVSDIIYLWSEKNQLTIYTGGVFRADTEYSISIDSTAKDLDGIKLGHPFSFSFKTTPVSITSSLPMNGELFVSPSTPIYLYFNTYMQKSTVQGAFSISPSVAGTLDWNNNSKTVMKFIPSAQYQNNTKYTVIISKQAKDLFGSSIQEPYSFSFITRPE